MTSYKLKAFETKLYFTLVPYTLSVLLWGLGFADLVPKDYEHLCIILGIILLYLGLILSVIQYWMRANIEINNYLKIKGLLIRKNINLRDITGIQILEELPPRDPSYRLYRLGDLVFYLVFITAFDLWLFIMKVNLWIIIALSIAFCAVLLIPYHLIIRKYLDIIVVSLLGGLLSFVIPISQGLRVESAVISMVTFAVSFFIVSFFLRRRGIIRERTLVIRYKRDSKEGFIFVRGGIEKGIIDFHNEVLSRIGGSGKISEDAEVLHPSEATS